MGSLLYYTIKSLGLLGLAEQPWSYWARLGLVKYVDMDWVGVAWPSPTHLATLDERDQRGRALSGAMRWRKRGKREGEGGEGERRGRGRGRGEGVRDMMLNIILT